MSTRGTLWTTEPDQGYWLHLYKEMLDQRLYMVLELPSGDCMHIWPYPGEFHDAVWDKVRAIARQNWEPWPSSSSVND